MATIIAQDVNEGALYLNAEADLSAAAAVTATRGTGFTCTKTGTGTYQFVLKGLSRGILLRQVLQRTCDLSGTPATAFWAKVTSVTQVSGGTSDGDIQINVATLNNAATPVATDTTGAAQLDLAMCIRVVADPAVAQL
jgi:hypothetical protein